MTKEYYVIELENGGFAWLNQESGYDIAVSSWSIDKIHLASFMDEDDANAIFKELNGADCRWNYYGECTTPKAIRKVTLELH